MAWRGGAGKAEILTKVGCDRAFLLEPLFKPHTKGAMNKPLGVCIGILFAGLASAGAANISWGTPQDITGNLSDFDSTGTFVLGYSGDTVSHTIAGLSLTFTNGGQLPNSVYNADSNNNFATVYPVADADYDNLLQNATWGDNPTAPSASQPASDARPDVQPAALGDGCPQLLLRRGRHRLGENV